MRLFRACSAFGVLFDRASELVQRQLAQDRSHKGPSSLTPVLILRSSGSPNGGFMVESIRMSSA